MSNRVVDDGCRDRLCLALGQASPQRLCQRDLQDLVHGLNQVDIQRIQYVLRNVCQILFVVFGKDDALDPGTMRGQDLFLHTADGQDFAAEGDLTRHGDVFPNRDARERRHER